MSSRKAKSKKPASTATAPSPKANAPLTESQFFPFARYTSVVGVHSALLGFSTLFLPRTTVLFELTKPAFDASKLTSRDKPQHPFLEALTQSPVSTLACICAGALMLQAWWGGWMRNWFVDYTLQGSDEEKLGEKALMDKERPTLLKNAFLATLASSPVFHIALVLFGAPITSYVLHTYLLALLISILTVFTPAYSLGFPTLGSDTPSLLTRMTWIRLFAEFSIRTPIERAMVYPVIGTFIGCWLGAFPIALDWDRPWQSWPLTPAFGAVLGYIIASLYALAANAIKFLADEHIKAERALQ